MASKGGWPMNSHVACKERLVLVTFSKAKLSFLLFISWKLDADSLWAGNFCFWKATIVLLG